MKSTLRNNYPTWKQTKTSFSIVMLILVTHIFWFAFGVLGFEYLPIFVSLDIGFMIFAIVHRVLFIPLAKFSITTAFFRESYNLNFLKNIYLFRDILVLGAFLRIGGYAFLLLSIESATPATPKEIDMIWAEKLNNPLGFLIALFLYITYLFFQYYQDRFMKIGDYYYEVKEHMELRKVNSQTASVHVRNRRKADRDKEVYSNSIKNANQTKQSR
ncbi:hypothetical protein [Psychrobacillus sp. FSL K6-1464]